MKTLFKSKKGMTLTEVIISLAVLGIVSAPLLMVFTNAAGIVKKTDERLEINAVTRIMKENVFSSVKYGGEGNSIRSYEDNELKDLKDEEAEGYVGRFRMLQIKGSKDKIYEQYMFDAERVKDFGEIGNAADTCEYLLTLKKRDGTEIQKLRIYINRLDP